MGWLSDGPWHVPLVCVYNMRRSARLTRGVRRLGAAHLADQSSTFAPPSSVQCFANQRPRRVHCCSRKSHVMSWLTRVRQLMQPRQQEQGRCASTAGACASAHAPTLQRARGRARAPTAGEGRVLTMPNVNGSLQTYAVNARTCTQMHMQMHLQMGAPAPDQRCPASRLSRAMTHAISGWLLANCSSAHAPGDERDRRTDEGRLCLQLRQR